MVPKSLLEEAARAIHLVVEAYVDSIQKQAPDLCADERLKVCFSK